MRFFHCFAASLALALAAGSLAACTSPEPLADPDLDGEDPADGEVVAEAAQAVLVCQGGGAPYNILCYQDGDGDGRGTGALIAVPVCSGSCASNGYAASGGDCNDANASRWQNLSCYTDADGDGYVASLTPATVCAGATCESVAGKVTEASSTADCDEGSAARFQLRSCYPDADGDHFGAGSAVQVCAGSSCVAGVSGYSYNSGDCNDGNTSIHPQVLETHEDGVDNDCENGVDQAEFFFDHPDVSTNTGSSITMSVRLRQATERSAALAGNLSAKIFYKKLESASGAWQVYPASGTTPMTVVSCVAGGLCKASVTLPDLDPLSVYTADLELYRTSTGLRIYPYGKNGASPGCALFSHCFNTDTLYSMTKGASSGALRDARWGMVMTALDTYGKFRNTNMGYWDSDLRNELEMAANDTAYCSEFYSSSAKDYLVDMNPCKYKSAAETPQCDPSETTASEHYISAMKSWFDAYGASQSYEYLGPDMSALRPGDWLGVNPNDSEPNGQHTQMFLAWDAAVDKYWFVEGNGGITADWNADPSARYDHSINVNQHHHCDDGAPQDATCGDDDYYIQRVGDLSVDMIDP